MKERKLILLVGTLLVFAAFANAQASRTWVSGVGDDANPCARTAPCKTFAGAISKTAAGGEIDALDPAGYGAVTVTKAITIDGGGGQVASVLVAGTNGIVLQAGPSDTVILRNLRINGIGTGINGIRWLAGKALTIENCDIFGFTTNGIDIAKSDGGKAFVRNTVVQNNGQAGISVRSTVNVTKVSIDGSRFDLNTNGVLAEDFSIVNATNSIAAGNAQAGFISSAGSGTALLNISNSESDSNNVGVQAGGNTTQAITTVSNVSMLGNNVGFNVGTGGTIKSFGNNANNSTTNGGGPTGPNLTLQ